MAPFVTSLPAEAENQRWSILAPEKGFEETIRSLEHARDAKETTFLWLNVFRDDMLAWLRVTPDLQVFEDDPRPGVYHLHRGTGVFLDEDGRDTDHWVEFYAFLTTEITAEGVPAGTIIMWSLTDMSSTSPDNSRRTA